MEIIQILQKIEWTKVVDSKCLQSTDGWQVSYSVELHHSSTSWPSAQCVFRVSRNGAYVMTWGCVSDDQQQVVNAFLEAKERAYEIQDTAERLAKVEAKNLLKSVID